MESLAPEGIDWYDLMHLADSALPVGGFAFSSGLESSVKLGLIGRIQDLFGYLQAYLEQAGSMDLPFMNSISQLSPNQDVVLQEITQELDATLILPSMKRASILQGRGLLRILEPLFPDAGIDRARKWMVDAQVPYHYLLVFALGMKHIGCGLADSQRLHLYIMLRDQVSAAIRLGIIGPMEGHVLQRRLHDRSEEIRAASEGLTYTDAVRTCPALEIAQGYHEQIYSRLFQN